MLNPTGGIAQLVDAAGDGVSPLSSPIGVAVDAAGAAYVGGVASDNAFRVGPPCGLFDELGGGLAGTHGVPHLSGAGTLCAGTTATFRLSDAAASAPVAIFVGLSEMGAPFQGGVLVPSPDLLVLGLVTDPSGGLVLSASWPDLPGGVQLFLQYWISDAAAVLDSAGSNAIRITMST
jgi:hypothetical protein